jgi:hypothetical protein
VLCPCAAEVDPAVLLGLYDIHLSNGAIIERNTNAADVPEAVSSLIFNSKLPAGVGFELQTKKTDCQYHIAHSFKCARGQITLKSRVSVHDCGTKLSNQVVRIPRSVQ